MTETPPAADPAAPTPPASPAPPPAAVPPGQPGKWFDSYSLEGELKDFVAAKNPPDFATLAKSWKEADALVRDRGALTRPDPAKIEDWHGWTDLGWLADRSEYQKAFTPPPFASDPDYSKGFEEAFVAAAHEARVPVKAMQAVYEKLGTYVKGVIDQNRAEMIRETEAGLAALRKEWGADYDRNREIARRAAQAFGLAGEQDEAVLAELAGAPRMLRALVKAAGMAGIVEDSLVTGESAGRPNTLDSIRTERRKLEADPAFMRSLQDARHPAHAENKARRQQLLDREAAIAAARR